MLLPRKELCEAIRRHVSRVNLLKANRVVGMLLSKPVVISVCNSDTAVIV
jgi:hypothetical protein